MISEFTHGLHQYTADAVKRRRVSKLIATKSNRPLRVRRSVGRVGREADKISNEKAVENKHG